MFTKGKWIWQKNRQSPDTYVDFVKSFSCGKKTTLRISSDSDYTVYVNGDLAAFGQYATYPESKTYDEIDISGYTVPGMNILSVTVWYVGAPFFTYKPGCAGLIYEIESDGEITAYSDTDTYCRLSDRYINGMCSAISGQLGFTYHCNMSGFDVSAADTDRPDGFEPSVITDGPTHDLSERPVKKLVLKDRADSKPVMQGVFTYPEERVNIQTDMQHASLSFRFPAEMGHDSITFPHNYEADSGDGIFVIVDLGSETSGFLDFDITVPEDTDMEVGYGEHLKDGRCRTSIRNFTADFKLRSGRNVFLNTFRRFGCRYLQFFIHSKNVRIDYAGLRPTEYPVTPKKPGLEGLLRNTIYEVCENTLIQCMHEHYEDCPWREQSLYTMDSRNQMLCGYYAFNEFEFPRACLKLISHGLREDGILSLCYPAGSDYPIPSFSLMYFIQVREYTDHSKDLSLAKEVYPVMKRLMQTFLDKIDERGLCPNFQNSSVGPIWNFYEWSDTMHGGESNEKKCYEAPLNADLSLALRNFSEVCRYLGKQDEADMYDEKADGINKAVAETFYNKETKLFRSFDDRHFDTYSVLTNSLCLLCGAADGLDTSRILDILSHNGGKYEGIRIVPNTLSMNSFRFDARLSVDKKKYRDVILDEIDRVYFYMLREGATSFWETIKGDCDFGYAGSLCHGWSALPIYYYEILNG